MAGYPSITRSSEAKTKLNLNIAHIRKIERCEQIAPVIYNQAISDAQTRLLQRVADLNGELYADEFQYWPRADARRKNRR